MAETASVRVGHCCPDAPNVDVHVDGEIAFEDVPFETISEYAELPAESHEIAVTPHGDDEAVLDLTVELEADRAYSALATGMLAEAECTVLSDAPGDVAADQTHVRFVHASPDAPAVDVRVANGGPTLCENIEFRSASEYVPVDAGSYDLEVLPHGSDDIALSLPDTELDGGAAVSAIAVGQAGDDSLGAVFADDTQ
ncbi:hypothetical protein DJ82_05700 [Halorubrum sp. Ib24]|uniref:DUF4397 domain-containing protein n=1 Tax=unclassified Halorubrum TaxID=2642239 RepID=UPI000B99258F|nr:MULTISPECIES: DUF4397 domain-containing protein [unclassified Halorubrum]OYR41268.1 hypothetical protein DJ82_05700 [Halorubrum sp. Ib24]OYR51664.1 hypothetical protein DJ73_12675 [Halorubrum sp. Ea1]